MSQGGLASSGRSSADVELRRGPSTSERQEKLLQASSDRRKPEEDLPQSEVRSRRRAREVRLSSLRRRSPHFSWDPRGGAEEEEERSAHTLGGGARRAHTPRGGARRAHTQGRGAAAEFGGGARALLSRLGASPNYFPTHECNK